MRLLAALAFPLVSYAASGADLARSIDEGTLDRAECYRVHDLQIAKDDAHLYFTDGYLIFGKPVGDTPVSAVFSADVEAGDAELLVLPPGRSERQSLASHTGSPNLDEHFGAAVLLFGDESYRDLTAQIKGNEFNRRSPEMGALMDEQWSGVVRNLASSFEARLLLDLFSPRRRELGTFIAAIQGKKLGNFDLIYEPRMTEQISVGQVVPRNNEEFFDVWTSFESAPFRKGTRKTEWPGFALSDYRISATLEPDLLLRVVTKVKVKPAESGERALPFEISGKMRISSATIDGQPVEVLDPASLRANLVRNSGNNLFLVVAPKALESGREYEVEFHHEGNVITDAGNQVYFVGPRSNWYPNAGMQFSNFDLTFRYAKNLDLVTPGEVVADSTEGDWRITRRVVHAPIRFAGFNLGYYKRRVVTRDGYTVEVCGNRPGGSLGAAIELPNLSGTSAAPEAKSRLDELADDVVSAFEFMTKRFGPPPLRTLEVSPIPGAFGQGFPGLLYLSTMSYLRREDAAIAKLGPDQQSFYIDVLQAHETAHQWWGNVVTPAGYHDEWLMESLANYSALLYLESRSGPRSRDEVLDGYRRELLAKNARGETVESAGPIVLGTRLLASESPGAWHRITYGKGSWVLHMLRALMGDDRFMAMLAELRKRYEARSITTEEFRALAAEFMPPGSRDSKLETFFDQWVYGTGIPSLTLSYRVQGRAPAIKLTGTISQSGVDSEFSVQAPVEIQTGNARQVLRVRTADSPVEFTVPLKQAPTKVALDMSEILAAGK